VRSVTVALTVLTMGSIAVALSMRGVSVLTVSVIAVALTVLTMGIIAVALSMCGVFVLTVGGIAVALTVLTMGSIAVAFSVCGVFVLTVSGVTVTISVISSHVEVRVAGGVLGVVSVLMLGIVLVIVGGRDVVLSVHIGVGMARHILGGLVMDGTSVGLMLKLDMRLFLMVLVVVVTVGNMRLFVVHGVVMSGAVLAMGVAVITVSNTMLTVGITVSGAMLAMRVAMAVSVVDELFAVNVLVNGLMDGSVDSGMGDGMLAMGGK